MRMIYRILLLNRKYSNFFQIILKKTSIPQLKTFTIKKWTKSKKPLLLKELRLKSLIVISLCLSQTTKPPLKLREKCTPLLTLTITTMTKKTKWSNCTRMLWRKLAWSWEHLIPLGFLSFTKWEKFLKKTLLSLNKLHWYRRLKSKKMCVKVRDSQSSKIW